MGNSEVGHLNLGAGAIVPQDLARIDDAVEDGDAGRERDAAGGVPRRAARAPDRARLRRRRALLRPPPAGARSSWPRSGGSRTSSSTPSPTAATRSPTGGARLPARAGRVVLEAGAGGSARSSGATGRWTATSAGTARRRPTTCSCTAAASTTRTPAEQAVEGRLRARRDRRVHHADDGRRRGAHPPRRRVIGVQLPARPDAPDHARARGGRLRRGRPRRRAVVERYTTLAQYEEDWDYPVVFPPHRPDDHDRPGHRGRRARRSCTSPRPRSTRT